MYSHDWQKHAHGHRFPKRADHSGLSRHIIYVSLHCKATLLRVSGFISNLFAWQTVEGNTLYNQPTIYKLLHCHLNCHVLCTPWERTPYIHVPAGLGSLAWTVVAPHRVLYDILHTTKWCHDGCGQLTTNMDEQGGFLKLVVITFHLQPINSFNWKGEFSGTNLDQGDALERLNRAWRWDWRNTGMPARKEWGRACMRDEEAGREGQSSWLSMIVHPHAVMVFHKLIWGV